MTYKIVFALHGAIGYFDMLGVFTQNIVRSYMTIDEFEQKLSEEQPKENWSRPLQAMWFDKKGFWDKAHRLIQDDEDGEGAWVHAYLHRKEGDIWNADYWYRRAGKKRPDVSLDDEWKTLTEELLIS